MSSLITFVKDQFVTKQTHPSFSSGDTITVYYEIKEGNKKVVEARLSDAMFFWDKDKSKNLIKRLKFFR